MDDNKQNLVENEADDALALEFQSPLSINSTPPQEPKRVEPINEVQEETVETQNEIISESVAPEEIAVENIQPVPSSTKSNYAAPILENERFINTGESLKVQDDTTSNLQTFANTVYKELRKTVEQPIPPDPVQIPQSFVAPPKNDNLSCGAYLKSIRTSLNLSIAQIAEESKISDRYIKALEADNISCIPAPVYVIAYIRKLCVLFRIDYATQEAMCKEFRDIISQSVPDAVVTKVELETEVTEESKKEVRRLMWILIALVAGVILVVTLLGIWLFKATSDDSTEVKAEVTTVAIDDEKLNQLLPKANLKVPELPAKN